MTLIFSFSTFADSLIDQAEEIEKKVNEIAKEASKGNKALKRKKTLRKVKRSLEELAGQVTYLQAGAEQLELDYEDSLIKINELNDLLSQTRRSVCTVKYFSDQYTAEAHSDEAAKALAISKCGEAVRGSVGVGSGRPNTESSCLKNGKIICL